METIKNLIKENKNTAIILVIILLVSVTIGQLASVYNNKIALAKAKIELLEEEVDKKSLIETILDQKLKQDTKIEVQKEKEAQAKLAYENEKKKKEVLIWTGRCIDLNYELIGEQKAIMPCDEYNEETLEKMFASYNFNNTKRQAGLE